MPERHVRTAFADLMAMAPLRMDEAEFRRTEVTTHSPHGTYADMSRFVGAAAAG